MRGYGKRLVSLSALVILLVRPPPAAAQSADELAKQTQNPVASLINVPLQGNWDFGLGDRDATGTLLNIQPVMPFGINPSTNVILRVIMPLTSQPGTDGVRVNGLGDIVATAFFSPAQSGRIIWGAGPVVLLPAATNNSIGTEKFGLGLGSGLSAGVSLEATGNWEADEAWTAPLLFNVSKVALLGKRPVNFQVAPVGGFVCRRRSCSYGERHAHDQFRQHCALFLPSWRRRARTSTIC